MFLRLYGYGMLRTTCTIFPSLFDLMSRKTSWVDPLASILHMEWFSSAKCQILFVFGFPWVVSRLNSISFYIFLTTNKWTSSIYHGVSLALGSNHRTHFFMLVLMLFLFIKIYGGFGEVNTSQHHDIILNQFDLLIFPLNVNTTLF